MKSRGEADGSPRTQFGNSVYLLLAAAVVIAAFSKHRPLAGVLLLALVSTLQLKTFAEGYAQPRGPAAGRKKVEACS